MNETREITIELSGIKKLYQLGTQEVAALNGIDLKIYKGEFAAVYGAIRFRKIYFNEYIRLFR